MGRVYAIVLVDDEPWTLVYLKELFDQEALGFHVIAAERSFADALQIIEAGHPDVVITDVRMPEISGLDLMSYFRGRGVECEFVIVSGFAEFAYAQQAVKLGAFDYCLKPLSVETVRQLLARLYKKLEGKEAEKSDPQIQEPLENETNFDRMLKFIEQNYNQRLYLKDLAQQFFLAPNYCCNLFMKKKGMTFSHYVTHLRMQRAALLLESTELTSARISQIIGFDDYAYFNKVFKKHFFITPSEYRKGHAAIQAKGV